MLQFILDLFILDFIRDAFHHDLLTPSFVLHLYEVRATFQACKQHPQWLFEGAYRRPLLIDFPMNASCPPFRSRFPPSSSLQCRVMIGAVLWEKAGNSHWCLLSQLEIMCMFVQEEDEEGVRQRKKTSWSSRPLRDYWNNSGWVFFFFFF